MNKNLQYPLLFLLLILFFFRCSSVRGEYDWLTPGSYAVYELSTPWVVRLNETYIMVGSPEDSTVARYGFNVVEVDDKYALLRVSFNESIRLPALFNTSSLSCMVWVDLETRNLVDRDTGEVWGKCPFWVYPWEAETNVKAFDFLNMTITWDYVSLMSEFSAREGKYSPTLSYLMPIGYFNKFDFIIASFGNRPDQTVITIETTGGGEYSFPLSFNCDFHAEKGLLLFPGTRYADDILTKKFGIIVCSGSLGMAKSEYSQEKLGWIVGSMIIYDTNILKGSDKPTVGGGGFLSYVPLLIAVVALLPLVYYVYVRRLSKGRS
jgi:hypothetical protein